MSKTLIRSNILGTEPLGENRRIQILPNGHLPIWVDNPLNEMRDVVMSEPMPTLTVTSHSALNASYSAIFSGSARQQCIAFIIDTTGTPGISFVSWRYIVAGTNYAHVNHFSLVAPFFNPDTVSHRVALFIGQNPAEWMDGASNPPFCPRYENMDTPSMQIGFAKTGAGNDPIVQMRRFYLRKNIIS